jgi:predicted lipid-binding transport protein (Tim44 family)
MFGHGIFFGPAWLIAAVFVLRFLYAHYQRDAMRRRRDGRPPLSFALVLSALTLFLLWPWDLFREWRTRPGRVRRVELAAAEATEDDPLFDPVVVRRAADELFRNVQAAWSRDDREQLAALAGRTLMVEWDRRLADFAQRGWRNEVDVLGDLSIEYVGLVNRTDAAEDEVCVRIAARVRDIVRDRAGNVVRRRSSVKEVHHATEYWTLGKPDGRWIVVRIEQHREGLHQLHERIVATPWADDERLHQQATTEQGVETAIAPADLSAIGRPEIDEQARLAALDLSLVDGRFAPDVLTAEVRYAVTTWLSAIDGPRGPLADLASPWALKELLYAGDPSASTRLVVRGLTVDAVHILTLATDETPARMTVEVHGTGVVYTEDRSTLIVVDGDRSRRRSFRQRWELTLTDDTAHPWRIVAAAAPTTA